MSDCVVLNVSMLAPEERRSEEVETSVRPGSNPGEEASPGETELESSPVIGLLAAFRLKVITEKPDLMIRELTYLYASRRLHPWWAAFPSLPVSKALEAN